jgi:hypothetical protein
VSLCPALLDHHPESRLLLMYHQLPRFLVGMLRTAARRDYVRNMLVRAHMALARSGKQELVRRDIGGDGRVAAYVWLAPMYPFLRLLAAAPDRVRSLDSCDLFTRPAETLRAVDRFFGFGLGDAQIDRRLAAGVMDYHSKDAARDFDSERYLHEVDQAASDLSAEIDDAVAWISELSRDEPIPVTLPHAL